MTVRSLALLALLLSGCSTPSGRPTTAPADLPRDAARPWHWFEQPAVATVEAGDFDALWDACEQAARRYRFQPDRADPRGGVLMTEPMIGAQFFEPWRDELKTGYDVAESSLATTRRTARFEIERGDDGVLRASPKVLIEKLAQAERRVGAAVLFRDPFGRTRPVAQQPRGSREADAGRTLPRAYWHAVGRDHALETALAEEIRRRVARAS